MTILKYIATLGFIGHIPFAPGTFGSFFAFVFYILLRPSSVLHIIILIIIIPIGIISSHYAEIILNEKDSKVIIIDEFCGFLISVLFIPFTPVYLFSAFILFRFFDILKPFPIKKVGNMFHGGFGIMADDIVSALYTNLIIQIIRFF